MKWVPRHVYDAAIRKLQKQIDSLESRMVLQEGDSELARLMASDPPTETTVARKPTFRSEGNVIIGQFRPD
jgi:hypothetical protein